MTRKELLHSICNTTADYRAGDLEPPTPAHVERWVSQFDPSIQLPVLAEMDHVLKKTYFSVEAVTSFLRNGIRTKKLVGEDPGSFWSKVKLLDVQGGGNSQRELNILFSEILRAECGVDFYQGDHPPSAFVYLDDGIFTGNRVRRDLEDWIEHEAPNRCQIHVICIALHSGGHYYAQQRINKKIKEVGKDVVVDWWRRIELEDRKAYTDSSDVLRPTFVPDNLEVQEYVEGLRYKPTFRNAGNIGGNGIFSSEEGRALLEQTFLVAGTKIRRMCPNLGETQRPLGHMTLESLGFGSLVVTFRNCPNNAPLALWAGEPWYPLFPRTTNSETAMQNLIARIFSDGS
ncbi:hypothetical protein DXI23_10285 [Marinobacter flavimaris]|uniref:PRTase-CE domain-containing protein n=1 Tax=Marinobacter flavimaris TaxID=262076 RepID=A0A3D8H3N3_9GAMM|nr:hypothetical protein [Marinobacter flavimaris]PPI80477.1 hypothetical protein MDHKLMBL_09190 [Marinobacter flavimaris]RDU40916.1 hypothetical protein DXI23_10285 [Marinobacter flavimaris]